MYCENGDTVKMVQKMRIKATPYGKTRTLNPSLNKPQLPFFRYIFFGVRVFLCNIIKLARQLQKG